MHYVMSDIHGCYQEFLEMLEKIHFNDQDILYIDGDLVDRGKESMKLLLDCMNRINVYPILGNHDYVCYRILKKLAVEITEENAENYLTNEDLEEYLTYIADGGASSIEEFRNLSRENQEAVLDYLGDFSLYEEIQINHERYIMVHAGLSNFDSKRNLDDYFLEELIFEKTDYQKCYFTEGVFLITGHTPVVGVRKDHQPVIIEDNGNIGIDCGCVYGYRLGCYCLETKEKFYVKSRNSRELSIAFS